MAQATQGTVNGVNVEDLKQTIGVLKQQPEMGDFRFRAQNSWIDGTHNRTKIRKFCIAGKENDPRTSQYVMDCGEPPVLLGRDEGANPVEYLLNALAGCVTTTMVAHAASRGIEIESLESELEGDIDVRGFLGMTNAVPKGYKQLRVTFTVKSDGDVETLKSLAAMSPVYNTITNPTPVEIVIRKK